jgi:hypothetical protein
VHATREKSSLDKGVPGQLQPKMSDNRPTPGAWRLIHRHLVARERRVDCADTAFAYA